MPAFGKREGGAGPARFRRNRAWRCAHPTAAVDRRFWAICSKNRLAGRELLSYDSNERMNQLFMEAANNHG
jgi:hypothetical protein